MTRNMLQFGKWLRKIEYSVYLKIHILGFPDLPPLVPALLSLIYTSCWFLLVELTHRCWKSPSGERLPLWPVVTTRLIISYLHGLSTLKYELQV